MRKTLQRDSGFVRLNVLPEQVRPTAEAETRLSKPVDPTDGDPFNPYKILNHFDKLQRVAAGHTVWPITVEVDPSNHCNHRCHWCVSSESHTGERLAYDDFGHLLTELKANGTESIVLKGGGEPTTHPDINQMLRASRQARVRLGLITNGSMPRPDTLRTVLDCADWVRISLDAAWARTHRQIHGTTDYHRILDHVEYLTTHTQQTLIGLNFVAERRNHDEMLDFVRLGKKLGVAYVAIRCVFDPAHPLSRRKRQVLRQQAAQAASLEDATFRVLRGNFTDAYLDVDASEPFAFRRCLGPNLVGVVGGDGEVYACCFLRGNKQFSFGNIGQQPFNSIWQGQRRQQVMQSVYRGECGYVCRGGMTEHRYNTYNQILNYLALEHRSHTEFA